MEVVTKVACCSLIAGGGGVTGAYGVYRISKAHDDAKPASQESETQNVQSGSQANTVTVTGVGG